MTCCAEDIRFIGFLCKYPELDNLKNGDWVTLTAICIMNAEENTAV